MEGERGGAKSAEKDEMQGRFEKALALLSGYVLLAVWRCMDRRTVTFGIRSTWN